MEKPIRVIKDELETIITGLNKIQLKKLWQSAQIKEKTNIKPLIFGTGGEIN